MKSSIKWIMLVVVAVASTSAWALFDPNTDASLVFNLNFQTNPSTTTTKDIVGNLTGVLEDYNTAGWDVFREDGIRGISADFNQVNDAAEGASDGNDCGFIVNPDNTDVFEFGDGWPGSDMKTFTFWFNMPNVQSGTFLRQIYQYDTDGSWYWVIRAYNGKLDFRHGQNFLRFETAEGLAALGVENNTWHHAAVIFDRSNARVTSTPTKSLSCKMYIDGAEVPIIVTYYNTNSAAMDSYDDYYSPLEVGRGDRDFDGLLDEVRMYNRALSDLEISLIYQNNPAVAHAIAILPVPKSENVSVSTDVNWVPATGATAQKVYFGTDSNMANLPQVASGNGSLALVSNTTLGGPFELATTYYWYVKSTIGTDVNSTLWSFTTETGKAFDPDPADGEEGVEVSDVNLSWSASATASSFDVYYSTSKAAVEANDPSVQIADDTADTNVVDIDTSLRGQTYYWRVLSNYSTETITGDTWSFTTRPYEIIFNTATKAISYQGGTIPALGVMVHANGWYSLTADGNSLDVPATANVIGTVGADGVVIYDFNTFSFDKRYGITVLPSYRGQDVNTYVDMRPIAIHVNNGGSFYFDGKIDISGDDLLASTTVTPEARSGGFVGPRTNSATTGNAPDNLCWNNVSVQSPYYHRFGSTTSSKVVYTPDSNSYRYFGPGIGVNPPYKGGGGSSYGGLGGTCGRAYFYGIRSYGPTYGDKEVPVPFGGSGGGWSGLASGTSGGGGIEIVADGDVVIDTNCVIDADGGNSLYPVVDYPGGGGSGGSVKIIAGGSVTNKGAISANGGSGGDTGKQANECGGGGGGGRIAIFYGTSYNNGGTINARGGEKGTYTGGGASLAEDGHTGTIYIVDSDVVSPKKASAPTPTNGDTKFYVSGSTIPLKWYSGFGASTDEVYFGTNTASLAKVGDTVTATRGQHTSTVNVTVTPGVTYYFKVITDGTISSDVWSFKVVNWQCPFAVASTLTTLKYVAGPTWDTNFDCVVTDEDFWYFAKDWKVDRITGTQNYTLDNQELAIFANEWMQCINRTDGCTSW